MIAGEDSAVETEGNTDFAVAGDNIVVAVVAGTELESNIVAEQVVVAKVDIELDLEVGLVDFLGLYRSCSFCGGEGRQLVLRATRRQRRRRWRHRLWSPFEDRDRE